jgi:hypothetical protein
MKLRLERMEQRAAQRENKKEWVDIFFWLKYNLFEKKKNKKNVSNKFNTTIRRRNHNK